MMTPEQLGKLFCTIREQCPDVQSLTLVRPVQVYMHVSASVPSLMPPCSCLAVTARRQR